MIKYKLVTDIRKNEILRQSFNELTEKVFGFNFINWYQNGFWGDNYVPYSLVDHDRVIANVSVNFMDFMIDGKKKKYIQLGTVMTAEDYRKQGLGRYIMEKVLEDYRGTVDGIYLFANDSAKEYYPKFGFTAGKEYQYSRKVNSEHAIKNISKVNVADGKIRESLLEIIKNIAENNNVHMDNYGLYTFYAAGMMSDQIYYCESEDTYAAADIRGNVLYLNQLMSKHKVNPDAVIASFGSDIKEVILGFVPENTAGYEVKEHREEDLTFYIMGDDLNRFEKQKLMFPLLSHA